MMLKNPYPQDLLTNAQFMWFLRLLEARERGEDLRFHGRHRRAINALHDLGLVYILDSRKVRLTEAGFRAARAAKHEAKR